MNTPTSLPSRRLAAFLALPLLLAAQAPAPSISGEDLLYEENFDRGTHPNGWFSFGGGKNITHRGDVIPLAGQDGTNAYVFTASTDSFEGYWFGGIGRNTLTTRAGVTVENLSFALDLALIGTNKTRPLSVRLIQGGSGQPTWTSTFKPVVTRAYRTFIFNLGEGQQTGVFDPELPVHLHAITFGHSSFGADPDVQVAVDNVRLFARKPPAPGTAGL